MEGRSQGPMMWSSTKPREVNRSRIGNAPRNVSAPAGAYIPHTLKLMICFAGLIIFHFSGMRREMRAERCEQKSAFFFPSCCTGVLLRVLISQCTTTCTAHCICPSNNTLINRIQYQYKILYIAKCNTRTMVAVQYSSM